MKPSHWQIWLALVAFLATLVIVPAWAFAEDKKGKRGTKPKSESEQYKSMPLETWDSPRGTSELGLPIMEGFAQPYPYGNLMRQYDGNKCRHRGLDIGAVGSKNGGLGTVVNAVTHSKVTLIGKAGGDVKQFGRKDTRTGMVVRTGRKYPRQIYVPGYGLVYPFTRNYGRWRSGTVVVTRVLDGPLKDYVIRYMHLADVRPDLRVGMELEAGEHLGIMGGTAVMDSHPHVHIDMETPDKKRVDLGPYIGLKGTGTHCGLPEVVFEPASQEAQSDEEEEMQETPADLETPILRTLQRQIWEGEASSAI